MSSRFELLYYMRVQEQNGKSSLQLADFKEYFGESAQVRLLLNHANRDGYISKRGKVRHYAYVLIDKGRAEIYRRINSLCGDKITPFMVFNVYGD